MAKLIEMVCTGNKDRSPLAQVVGNDYLRSLGRYVEYQVTSSGIHVSGGINTNLSIDFMQKRIDLAKDRGTIYSPEELTLLEITEESGDPNALRLYYHRAMLVFHAETKGCIARVLPELGIEEKLKQQADQTVIVPDTVVVFAMEKLQYDFVQLLYRSSPNRPKIFLLSAYATGTSDEEIHLMRGIGEEAYKAAMQRVIDHVPPAIDRLLEEFGSGGAA